MSSQLGVTSEMVSGFLLYHISINGTMHLSSMFLMPTNRPVSHCRPGRVCSPSGTEVARACGVLQCTQGSLASQYRSQYPHAQSTCQLLPQVSAVYLLLYVLSGGASRAAGTSYLRKIPLRLGVESKALAGTALILLFCRYRYSSDGGSPSGISVS